MKMHSLVPMLATTDIHRTINFYTQQLGFNLAAAAGDFWCCLERDGVEIMFNTPPKSDITRDVPAKAKNYQIFYFKPSSVEALHAEYTIRGVAVTPLRVTEYHMKEFELRDPEGYWLWFGQETDEPPTQEDQKDCD